MKRFLPVVIWGLIAGVTMATASNASIQVTVTTESLKNTVATESLKHVDSSKFQFQIKADRASRMEACEPEETDKPDDSSPRVFTFPQCDVKVPGATQDFYLKVSLDGYYDEVRMKPSRLNRKGKSLQDIHVQLRPEINDKYDRIFYLLPYDLTEKPNVECAVRIKNRLEKEWEESWSRWLKSLNRQSRSFKKPELKIDIKTREKLKELPYPLAIISGRGGPKPGAAEHDLVISSEYRIMPSVSLEPPEETRLAHQVVDSTHIAVSKPCDRRSLRSLLNIISKRWIHNTILALSLWEIRNVQESKEGLRKYDTYERIITILTEIRKDFRDKEDPVVKETNALLNQLKKIIKKLTQTEEAVEKL